LRASSLIIPHAPQIDFNGYVKPYFENVRNRYRGYRTQKITFVYKGESCSIPVTYPDVPNEEWQPKILALHGITDSQEGFYPWMHELRRSDNPLAEKFLLLDWPHNGDAKCDQAVTPEEIAEVIHSTLESFAAWRKLPGLEPDLIVGHSMGAYLTTILADKYYPESCLAAIAPALPNTDGLTKLQRMIGQAKTIDDATTFARFIRKDGRALPLPWLTHRRMLGWMKHAAPVMNSMGPADLDRMNERLSRISPLRYLWIAQGRLDILTPAEESTSLLKGRFFGRLQSLSCAHNITRECPELIPPLPPELCGKTR
jgi:pimeloyl-ACP methyl ester carboxylesterase